MSSSATESASSTVSENVWAGTPLGGSASDIVNTFVDDVGGKCPQRWTKENMRYISSKLNEVWSKSFKSQKIPIACELYEYLYIHGMFKHDIPFYSTVLKKMIELMPDIPIMEKYLNEFLPSKYARTYAGIEQYMIDLLMDNSYPKCKRGVRNYIDNNNVPLRVLEKFIHKDFPTNTMNSWHNKLNTERAKMNREKSEKSKKSKRTDFGIREGKKFDPFRFVEFNFAK